MPTALSLAKSLYQSASYWLVMIQFWRQQRRWSSPAKHWTARTQKASSKRHKQSAWRPIPFNGESQWRYIRRLRVKIGGGASLEAVRSTPISRRKRFICYGPKRTLAQSILTRFVRRVTLEWRPPPIDVSTKMTVISHITLLDYPGISSVSP